MQEKIIIKKHQIDSMFHVKELSNRKNNLIKIWIKKENGFLVQAVNQFSTIPYHKSC